ARDPRRPHHREGAAGGHDRERRSTRLARSPRVDRQRQVRRRDRRARRSRGRHHATETRHVRDEGRQGGGAMSAIRSSASCAVVTVRVKIDERKISEAEWLIARKGEWGPNGPGGNVFNAESLAMNPPPERTVPKAQRLARESLVAVTNSYFDGLTTHDGTIIQ